MCGGYTGEYDAGIEDNNHKHGSAYDRGNADSYYGRPKDPHYYPNGTYNDPRIVEFDMTPAQIDEHLFWAYQRNKSRWRKHMRKPTSRVRRFVKRKGNQEAAEEVVLLS